MKKHNNTGVALVLTASVLTFAACNTTRNSTSGTMGSTQSNAAAADASVTASIPRLKPAGADPDWGKGIDNNMLVVIEKLTGFGAPPLETLSPQEARKQPSPADAAKAVMQENNIKPAATVGSTDISIPVNGTALKARVYKPYHATGMLPVIVYYHGGGWVIADLDTYDASARSLAEKVGAMVVSVHYRQAPEHKFPTAHNDAFAAYEWVVKNAATMSGDAKRIAVAGESAGGNLACNVSIMARDKGIQLPVHQLLVYPIANNDMNNGSYQKYANAKPLNKAMMAWFAVHYLNNMGESADPRISLVNAKLTGLPATTLITAQIDPLHDEGRMLADRLRAAGVAVDAENYEGVTHEFFGMAALLPEAQKAQARAAENLKGALGVAGTVQQ